jgi:hypothetical protein
LRAGLFAPGKTWKFNGLSLNSNVVVTALSMPENIDVAGIAGSSMRRGCARARR